MAFCTKCGKQISTGVKFCTSCGAAVAGKVAAAQTDMPVIEEKVNVAEEVVNDSVQMQTEIDVQCDADETEEDPYIMERQQAAQIYSKNIFITLGFLVLAVVMGVIALKYPTTTVTTYSASEEINLRETPGADGKIIKPLPVFTKVNVLDDTQDWFGVEVEDGGDMLSGFVNSKYLTTETSTKSQITETTIGKIVMGLLTLSIIMLVIMIFYFKSICPNCKMKNWKQEVGTEYLGKSVERRTETEYDRVETISTRTGKSVAYQDIPRHTRVKETYQHYRTYYQCPFCGYEKAEDSKHLVDREES